MNDRPDQLDQQVALATNTIRRRLNEWRVNNNMAKFVQDYPIETAQTIYDKERR